MTSRHQNHELRRLALSVLQPGFVGTEAPDWVLRDIRDGLASVVLFARNIVSLEQVARLTAQLRTANPELIVAIDEEAGDVTRIESADGSSRPGNLALGVIDDADLTRSVITGLGHQLRAAGVSLDYAPSADVNSNPDNPIIGVRSFGADPALVSRHTDAWIRGLQTGGVAACAKHFPGHGDVAVDSHHGLPVYVANRAEITAQALPPFRSAIKAGVRAIMTGHLLVPAYDSELPATLSPRILGDLLRGELGFDGLIVTDAIEMGAVADRYGIGGATVRAIAAGADAICVGGGHADEGTVVRLAKALTDAVLAGDLPLARLEDASARVREFAVWSSGLAEDAVDVAGDEQIGLTAARRAVRLSGAVEGTLPLPAAPHVVELSPMMNVAVGKETPWGVAEPLRALMAATTSFRVGQQELSAKPDVLTTGALGPATGRPLVVVVRDAARHAWMNDALTDLITARPDAVVVEMGLPAKSGPEAVRIFTHGATAACGQAAAEVLTDAPGTQLPATPPTR